MKTVVTMKMIANEVGVSLSTVSKAINDYPDINPQTRQIILQTAQRMRYVPNQTARNLAKQATNTIGVILPDITNFFYCEIFKSLTDAARNTGYNLFLCDSSRSEKCEAEYTQRLLETQVAGIIVAPNSERISQITELTSDRVPVVFIGGKVEDEREHFVSSGNLAGGRIATEYLISLGHENITVISDSQSSQSIAKRIDGYTQCMRNHDFVPRIILNDRSPIDSFASGYRMMKDLIGDRMPTAIFAVKDMLGIGALQAASEAGVRVPHDISIIGYDDIYVSSLPMTRLTTIAQPKQEMAKKAIDIILRLIADGTQDKYHHFTVPRLIERESCGPMSQRIKLSNCLCAEGGITNAEKT